jgi:hypothetical protein
MRDNFDSCDVMSSRVKDLDSEVWRLQAIAFEMKVVKGLLREIIRRLPEEEHSVVYDKMMKGSKPADHQVAGVNAGSFPASAHDNLLFPTHRKMYEPKATGLKGGPLTVRPYKGVNDGEMRYDDPFSHTSAVATKSEAAPAVTDNYIPSITKSMEVSPAMAPSFAKNDESAGPSHIDPQLVDFPNLSATILPVHSPRQSPASFRTGSPLPFEFKAPNIHDGFSHLSTANPVLDDSPPPTPPSPSVLPNMRNFDTTQLTLPPPSKMAPPPTSQSGSNADELPAVNLQPPTPQTDPPQTDREVDDPVPQTLIIRPRPIPKRMPAQSSGTADDAQDNLNPAPAALTVPSDSLHPPSEVRMTRSRAHSSGPLSPAGKRKADNANNSRPNKRRK